MKSLAIVLALFALVVVAVGGLWMAFLVLPLPSYAGLACLFASSVSFVTINSVMEG